MDEEVKKLLQLKVDFKNLTGKDWKPNMKPEPSVNTSVSAGGDNSKEGLTAKITDQGNLVRDLKAKKATKVSLKKQISVLRGFQIDNYVYFIG